MFMTAFLLLSPIDVAQPSPSPTTEDVTRSVDQPDVGFVRTQGLLGLLQEIEGEAKRLIFSSLGFDQLLGSLVEEWSPMELASTSAWGRRTTTASPRDSVGVGLLFPPAESGPSAPELAPLDL